MYMNSHSFDLCYLSLSRSRMNVDPDSACNYEANCLILIAKILQQQRSRMDALNQYLALISYTIFLAVCLLLLFILFRLKLTIQQVLPGVDWFARISDLIRLIKQLDQSSAHPDPTVMAPSNGVEQAESREYAVRMTRDRYSISSDVTLFAIEPANANLDHETNHASHVSSGDDIHITVPKCTSSSNCHTCGSMSIV